MVTWADEIPWVLLSLRAQLREDTRLSPAEAVFGTPLVLPNEFLQVDECSVDNVSTDFSKILDAPASPLSSKHNAGRQLPEELPNDLLRAPLIWVRCGGVVLPLQWPYDAPLAVLRRSPHSFTTQVKTQTRSSLSAT